MVPIIPYHQRKGGAAFRRDALINRRCKLTAAWANVCGLGGRVTEEVFISYSHDSVEHIERVLALSDRLRADGVDCVLDQYEECPAEGWPRWMDKKVRDAHFVLMVCTPAYYRRIMGEETPGTGNGVRWEGNLIYQHTYNAGSSNTKFIPVLFEQESMDVVPAPLQGTTIYRLDADFMRLYARLTGQPYTAKPALGERKPLPAKEVKTNPSMFLVSPIDIDLWNKARWRGTFYLLAEDGSAPPVLGFGFRDAEAGTQIFRGWHERYGDGDEFEELRISIVEWDKEPPGTHYTVHVSADHEAAAQRYKAFGFSMDGDLMMMVSRHNRMEPATSRNLDLFKQLYRRHKTYYLAPGWISEDGRELKPMPELGIHKGKIHFRKASEVGRHDPDIVVVGIKSEEEGD